MFDDDYYNDDILDDEDTSAEEGEDDDIIDDEEQDDGYSSDDTDDEEQDDGTKDKNAEAKFTQDDVNKIVQKRLRKNESKIRAEYESKLQGYGVLNEIIDDLHEYGYEGTPEEISKVLKKQVKDLKMQQGMSEAEYDYMQNLKSLNKKVDSLIKGKTDADAAAKQQAEFQEQVDELEAAYKDKGITVEKLRHDPKFVRFNKIADPRLTLKQVLDIYLEMNGDAEADAIAKIKLNSKRSTHSGKGVGGDDGTYGLSKDEIELVREFNKENPDHKMSFKEFASRKHE